MFADNVLHVTIFVVRQRLHCSHYFTIMLVLTACERCCTYITNQMTTILCHDLLTKYRERDSNSGNETKNNNFSECHIRALFFGTVIYSNYHNATYRKFWNPVCNSLSVVVSTCYNNNTRLMASVQDHLVKPVPECLQIRPSPHPVS